MTKYRLTSKRVFWWPVSVTFPDPDPKNAGQVIEETFNVQLEETPRDEARAFGDEMAKLPAADREVREHDLLIGKTKGWDEDVVDYREQPVPFTETALREAMQSVFFRSALYTAYAQSQTGAPRRPPARLGN